MPARNGCRSRHLVSIALMLLGLVASACSYQSRSVAPVLPTERQSSRVFAADGTEITTFFFEENRTNVPLASVPEDLRQAVVAIEDERYYQHRGVDLRAILRALQSNTASGDIAEGGSTITQQYVKNALLENDDKTLSRKVEEASLALELERQYSKDRILELYLNTIFFGNEAYGVAAASYEYFDKPVEELTLPESALLAGLINSPSRFDPYDEPDAALERRKLVFDRMVSNGYLTATEAEAAAAAPLGLTEATPPETDAYPAAYFVEEVKQWMLDDPRFGETAVERRDLVFGGGLRIYTTVDLITQFQAEAAVSEVLPDASTAPDAALVAVEPDTGFVRAMVGGRDFFGADGNGQKLNLATQTVRQPGSSFKPIVLATALDDGIDITTTYPAPGRITLDLDRDGQSWTVSNYGGGGGGTVSLLEATLRSYNTVYAQLMLDVGAERAIEKARGYGIASPIRPFEAAVLGSEPVTALDMASTYGTFANRGVHVPPVMVTKILNPDGTVLYEHEHVQDRVLTTTSADQLTDVLRQNIERGTGTRAQIGRPAAGKTGTTSDWRDAWFVGYTPELATSVWVGFQEPGRFMVPPNTPIRVTGGSYPAGIWGAFMGYAHGDLPVTTFAPAPPPRPAVPAASEGLTPSVVPGPSSADGSLPTLIGLSVFDATEVLASKGLVPNIVEVADEDQFVGHVVAQDPPAGSTVAVGTVVTIEIRAG
ncbi:MAG TPA: PBP1A family penicillin-binding protein [Acidimicrobiales bacterium]|nr:PBP1A family penicillin-binding protein [Acidimicrobiales bacterium]